MRRTLPLLCIVLALAAAGCTALPSTDDGDTGFTVRGLVIDEATIVDPVVGRGQQTELVLRLANTNPTAVRDVTATLSNLGPVTADGSCSFGAPIPAATGNTPTTRTCVWTLDTSGLDAADEGTYPLGLTLEYTADLTMSGDTPKVTFTDDLPSRVTASNTYTNGELTMTTTSRQEYTTGSPNISVDITLRNVGSGDLVPDGASRTVSLSYSGSLLDIYGFAGAQSEQRCTTAHFLTGERSASITCVLSDDAEAGSGTDGTTYSLRIAASYDYRRYTELPFQVVAPG